jgi:two-component system nitrogen regulation response regulator NtrX
LKTEKFREDLYHRLNVSADRIYLLYQSRTEDIPLLIDYFKKKLSDTNGVRLRPEIDIHNND